MKNYEEKDRRDSKIEYQLRYDDTFTNEKSNICFVVLLVEICNPSSNGRS